MASTSSTRYRPPPDFPVCKAQGDATTLTDGRVPGTIEGGPGCDCAEPLAPRSAPHFPSPLGITRVPLAAALFPLLNLEL